MVASTLQPQQTTVITTQRNFLKRAHRIRQKRLHEMRRPFAPRLAARIRADENLAGQILKPFRNAIETLRGLS
jgi:hypothetical protein